MNAEIVTIGNELLNGTTVNSNASWIADQLWRIGIPTTMMITVGDQATAIQTALADSLKRADVVLMTGGLGPTHDDITKKSVSDFFHSPLVENKNLRSQIEKIFASRNVPMPPNMLDQAFVPKYAKIIPNEVGTAVGFYFSKNGKYCFVMPGVPAEMKNMMQNSILSVLQNKFSHLTGTITYQTIRTTSIFESQLYEELKPLEELSQLVELAFLPHHFGVDIRLMSRAQHADNAKKRIEIATNKILSKIEPYVYEVGERSLEQVVADLLIKKNYSIACAESCTGGLLANLLTNISGSSSYFLGSIVAYDNAVKIQRLGVRKETIEQFGAVSEATAKEMAAGVQKLTGSNCALSTTGIAGPTGGSAEKPVGLVYIGCIINNTIEVQKFIFHRDRLINKYRFAFAALNLLRQKLLYKRIQL